MPSIIAWDIETGPQPLHTFSDRQKRRYDMLWKKEEPDADQPSQETSDKVRSLHPMLGYISAIAAVRLRHDDEPGRPWSLTAASPDEEAQLLREFWDAIRAYRRTIWVTFNGKQFDCDWLRVRSAHHGIRPSRTDILDRYPFKHTPHADLSKVFTCRSGLADLCDLLAVPDPKEEAGMDGSGVATALARNDTASVGTYCEADVVATLRCYVRLRDQL